MTPGLTIPATLLIPTISWVLLRSLPTNMQGQQLTSPNVPRVMTSLLMSSQSAFRIDFFDVDVQIPAQQALFFRAFQGSEGKHESSEEPQTRPRGKAPSPVARVIFIET